MVKYGIISDTHFTSETNSESLDLIFKQIRSIFRNVDAIIHAGDISNKKFLDKLNSIVPTKAIRGESDNIEELPHYLEINAGKYRIGVIHKRPSDLEAFFREKNLNILIFGHTHQPLIVGTSYNTLLINPGSPTLPKAPSEKHGFNKPIPRPSVITMNIDENNILSTYIINLKV
ncbi:MAG: metallophosphoesterase [Promethearchaeota archaeon]|nr:MAG: metallophosphoesterase [Candidatus Lokiarchaeota archaeon]